jgi:hypothetical protein
VSLTGRDGLWVDLSHHQKQIQDLLTILTNEQP